MSDHSGSEDSFIQVAEHNDVEAVIGRQVRHATDALQETLYSRLRDSMLDALKPAVVDAIQHQHETLQQAIQRELRDYQQSSDTELSDRFGTLAAAISSIHSELGRLDDGLRMFSHTVSGLDKAVTHVHRDTVDMVGKALQDVTSTMTNPQHVSPNDHDSITDSDSPLKMCILKLESEIKALTYTHTDTVRVKNELEGKYNLVLAENGKLKNELADLKRKEEELNNGIQELKPLVKKATEALSAEKKAARTKEMKLVTDQHAAEMRITMLQTKSQRQEDEIVKLKAKVTRLRAERDKFRTQATS